MCDHISQQSDATSSPVEHDLQGPVGDPNPLREYQRQARTLLRQAPGTDARHLDWLVAKKMAARGYSRDAIMQAMAAAHIHPVDHIPGDKQEYITHLMDEVMQLPDVIVSRNIVLESDDEYGLGF